MQNCTHLFIDSRLIVGDSAIGQYRRCLACGQEDILVFGQDNWTNITPSSTIHPAVAKLLQKQDTSAHSKELEHIQENKFTSPF
jgi:hypothetical protein